MDDSTCMFMPLRSNAAWFGNANGRERLERQIKTYLVLYDRIILEDGRYYVVAGVDGQGMQMIWPGDSCPRDRTKITFFTPGGEFGASVGDKRILTSTSHSAYEVDYLPIVRDAGLEHATYISWSNDEISPEFKNVIGKRVSAELHSKVFHDVLPDNTYLRKHLLEGMYRDSLMAHFLNSPFSVDFHVSPVIARQQQRARHEWSDEIPVAFFNYWINLRLPDFTELPWDALCEFRETDAGVSFRRMIHDVSKRVKVIIPDVADQRDLDQWLAQEFSKELLTELSGRVNTPGGMLASICLNVIPYGVIPSIIKDAKSLYDDRTSWVSVVRKYKSTD